MINIEITALVQSHLKERLGLRIVKRDQAEADRGNIMLPATPMKNAENDGWVAIHRVFVRDFSKTAYAESPEFYGEPAPDLTRILAFELRTLTKNKKLRVLMRRVGPDGREYQITHPYDPEEESGGQPCKKH